MALGINELRIRCSHIFGENALARIYKVSEWRKFQEGVAMESRQLLGYQYMVGCPNLMIRFQLNIPSQKALITNEEVATAGKDVYLKIADGICNFRGKSLYDVEIVVESEQVSLVADEEQAQPRRRQQVQA